MVRDFLKAEEYRRDRENYNAWLNGAYVARAISSTICNAFIGKSDTPSEYPDRPIPLRGETEAEQKTREEKEAEAAEVYMKQFIDFGKNWGKKSE